MAIRTIGFAVLAIIPAALVGGCATVPTRYSYYHVPCTTPGAVLATPVAGAGQIPVAPGYPDPSRAPGVTGGTAAASCIVAVRDGGYGYYGAPYYGRYGYGRYGYGSPFYGSFGVGFGFGHYGHFSGRHWRGRTH